MNRVYPPTPTDGYVLTADSTASDGVSWQAGGVGGGAPTGAEYLVLTLHASLTGERRLQLGTGLSAVDGGANGDYTISPALDLAALEGLGTTGLAVRTGTSTWTTRTLTGPAAGLTVSNGDGVAGAPTLALANDLAALEALASTGMLARTAAETYALRTITGSAGVDVTNGDGVSGNPTISLPGLVVTVLTTAGYTTVTLPDAADCSEVTIECVGSGGGGGGGTTGTNAANRAGGGGGASSASMEASWERSKLPDSLEVYVGGGAAGGTPGGAAGQGEQSLVEVTNTGYSGGTPQYSSTVAYSGGIAGRGAQGSLGGGAGTAGTIPTTAQCFWLHCASSFLAYPGQNGQAGGASGTPTAVTPFGTSGSKHAPGCGGAGKSAVPADAVGGNHAAQGHFGATTGGANPGGAGNDGTFGGGAGAATTYDAAAYTYGGTGGASHTAGTGGVGGVGKRGSGGGGGGAGTTAGGDGGDSDPGYVVITCRP